MKDHGLADLDEDGLTIPCRRLVAPARDEREQPRLGAAACRVEQLLLLKRPLERYFQANRGCSKCATRVCRSCSTISRNWCRIAAVGAWIGSPW